MISVVEVVDVVVVVVVVVVEVVVVEVDKVEVTVSSVVTMLVLKFVSLGDFPPPSRLKPPLRSSFSIKRKSSCKFPDLEFNK